MNLDISWRGVKQAGRSGEIWNLRPHKPESADLNYKSSNWAVQVRRMLERRDELQDRNDRGCRSNDPEISATVGVLEVHLPARALQSLILVPGANEFTLSTGFDTLRSPQTRREKNGFHEPSEVLCDPSQLLVFSPGRCSPAASNSAAYLGSNLGTKPARFQ